MLIVSREMRQDELNYSMLRLEQTAVAIVQFEIPVKKELEN